MAKDKKAKKKKPKSSKSGKSQSPSVAERFKAISDNPLIAEFVSAALFATAAALKDASKVRRVASEAGGDLTGIVKQGAERGHDLWEMALQVARRSVSNLLDDKAPAKGKTRRAPAASKTATAVKRRSKAAVTSAPKKSTSARPKKPAATKAKAPARSTVRKVAAPKAPAQPT
ncbi:MAG: hypothetical protein ABIR25_04920 [Sphingomicrobium sp.]